MDKERGKGKYDGFTYYKSHIFANDDSSYNKFNADYFTNFAKKYAHVDNSQNCVLDLQGGSGKWGSLVAKALKAKKCVVTEYSEGMAEFGRTLHNPDEVEFHHLDFNTSLTSENITKNKYCAIIIKEAIHFADKGYSEKLMNFFRDHCTQDAFILCNGVIRTRHWKVKPEELPKTCLENLENLAYDDIDFADEIKLISEDRKLNVNYDILAVPYHWPLEEYTYFLKNRSWSSFRTVPQEELDACVQNQVDKKNEWVKYDVYFAYINITKK